MILSFQHDFLFLKTKKTAGTSLELALSPLAGPDAIVTPVAADDEILRLSGDRPRNFGGDLQSHTYGRDVNSREFFNHMSARAVRERIGEATWTRLFKFTIERNPWDRQVSLYHWYERRRLDRCSFDEFMKLPRARMDNFSIYSLDGEIAVDQVIRYERLTEALAAILRHLGLPAVALARAKGAYRPTAKHYSTYYTPQTRDLVAEWYAREIDTFSYRFEEA